MTESGTCGECGRPPDNQCTRCLGYVEAARRRGSAVEAERDRLRAALETIAREAGNTQASSLALYVIQRFGELARTALAPADSGHGQSDPKHGSTTVSDGDPCKPPRERQ